MVSCNNKDKTGGSDNGGDSSSEGGGNSDSSDGSSSGGDSSGGSGSGDSDSGEGSSGGIVGTTSGSTGSGKKADLEGEWSGGSSFGITNGKLSMSLFWGPTYEGQIPDSFNYPFSIISTGILDGKTKTGIFTFYSATNGAYYYYNASGSRLLGNIEKKGSSGSGGSSAGEVSSSGVTNYGSRTGSGVKSELTGNWYAGGGNNNFTITDGKLSMSSSTPTYEGQIPDSFNYPLNIVLTGTYSEETKTAIFTFYSATNGTCYYYRFDSTSSSWTTSFIGDSHKLKN